MQIIVDIGNTDAVFGLYDQTNWQHIWRTPARTDEPAESYERRLRLWLLEAAVPLSAVGHPVVSSVVPDLTPTMRTMLSGLFGVEPVVVGPGVYPRLPLEILRPHEIGADLVANALAAYTRYRRNCVVVDFGLSSRIPSLHDLFIDVVPSLTLEGVRLIGEAVAASTQ